MPNAGAHARYKWIALSNTTLGVLMATVNASILLIALPHIFRGIRGQPAPAGQHEPAALADHGLLGYNPVQTLLGHALVTAPDAVAAGV